FMKYPPIWIRKLHAGRFVSLDPTRRLEDIRFVASRPNNTISLGTLLSGDVDLHLNMPRLWKISTGETTDELLNYARSVKRELKNNPTYTDAVQASRGARAHYLGRSIKAAKMSQAILNVLREPRMCPKSSLFVARGFYDGAPDRDNAQYALFRTDFPCKLNLKTIVEVLEDLVSKNQVEGIRHEWQRNATEVFEVPDVKGYHAKLEETYGPAKTLSIGLK
ncbi:MAG: hypothetical protein ACI8Y7_001186, partial [Candidatus Woesearchaeota archaeon]